VFMISSVVIPPGPGPDCILDFKSDDFDDYQDLTPVPVVRPTPLPWGFDEFTAEVYSEPVT
jgi:hypothetical protein